MHYFAELSAKIINYYVRRGHAQIASCGFENMVNGWCAGMGIRGSLVSRGFRGPRGGWTV